MRRITDQVNALDVDVLAHTGDLVDGSLAHRAQQVEPLGAATARDARVFITGNHEYFSGAREWTELHELAGLDRAAQQPPGAAPGRRRAGARRHRRPHRGRLRGAGARRRPGPRAGRAPAGVPVVLLAHQPRQVLDAVDRVDLQLSGHTHGGQLWPFHYLVRLDQPTLHGLSRHGARTQLYTSRGTGFWGPPFRIFAPPEIAVLTLRSARSD